MTKGPVSIVTELYEPSVGGQESRFARFAEALAGRGREVTVYTTDPTGGTLPRQSEVKGVRVNRYVTLTDYVRNGSRGWAPLLAYWRATRRLLRELVPRPGSVWVNEMPVVDLLGTSEAPNLVVDWCEYPTYWMVNLPARRLMKGIRRGTAVSEAVAGHLRAVRPDAQVDVVRTPVALPTGPAPQRDDRYRLLRRAARWPQEHRRASGSDPALQLQWRSACSPRDRRRRSRQAIVGAKVRRERRGRIPGSDRRDREAAPPPELVARGRSWHPRGPAKRRCGSNRLRHAAHRLWIVPELLWGLHSNEPSGSRSARDQLLRFPRGPQAGR